MRKMFVALFATMCVGLSAGDSLPTLIKRFERGSWGYQELTVDLGSHYSEEYRNYNFPSLDTSDPNEYDDSADESIYDMQYYGYDVSFRYDRQKESERTCYDFMFQPSYDWSSREYEYREYTSNDGHTEKTGDETVKKHFLRVRQSLNSQHYFNDDYYVAFNTAFDGSRQDKKNYYIDGDTYEKEVKDLDIMAYLGLGRGRLRDVTNVVRAKWMADRLRYYHNIELNDEQILLLAQYLDKQTAYTNILDWYRDASDATFWRDVMDDLGLQLTYDQFLDMTREARSGTLLNRKQGLRYEIDCFYKYAYYDYKSCQESFGEYTNKEETEKPSYGLYGSVGYWNNVSVQSQISFSLPVRYSITSSKSTVESTIAGQYEKDEETMDFTLLSAVPSASYLLQLTDRIGLEVTTSVGYYMFEKDVEYSYLSFDEYVKITAYLNESTRLVGTSGYTEVNYFDDDAIENGGRQYDYWYLV